MKNSALILGVFFTFSAALAAAPETTTFEVGGKKTTFHRDMEKHLTISADCKKDGKGQFTCQAYQALKKATLKKAKAADLAGGVNPGAYICDSVVKGKIVYGFDSKRNEQTFCEFQDGSRISNGSLHAAAIQADEKK